MDIEKKQPINVNFYSKQLLPFMTGVAFILGAFVGFVAIKLVDSDSSKDNTSDSDNTSQSGTNSSSSEYDSEYVDNVINILEDKYIEDFDDSEKKTTYGVVKGIVQSLGNKYTIFLDPEEAKAYFAQASGDFEGIGVVLAYNGEYTYVETVLKGFPAEKAGMLPGDIIKTVDDKDVVGELPGTVADLVRGEADSFVKIKVVRLGETDSAENEFNIQRKKIEVDNVTWKKIDEKTAKIDISQFSDVSAVAFNSSWDKIVAEVKADMPNLESVVLDLRNNPGGYVYSVRHVMEEFYKGSAVLMKEKMKGEDEVVYKDSRKGELEDVKLVVLVNEGSASASEIFASAVQDNDRGKVVGKKTVGKGVEQELVDFKDGSMLLVVFQQWLTPDGHNITPEEPITPDYEVEYTTEDYKKVNDTQLNKAVEVLKEL